MHGPNSIAVTAKSRPGASAQRRPNAGSQAIVAVQSSGATSRNGSSFWGSAPDPEQWIEEWEKRTAAAAVRDLENSGADQDLEALRAGWSTSERPAWHAGLVASRMNQRGDIATRRLSTVNHLRRIAEGQVSPSEASESSVPGALCLADASSSHPPQQRRSKAAIPRNQQTSSNASAADRKPVGRRPSPHRVLSPLKAMLEDDDPWSAWEQKWADAFEQLGAHSLKATRLPSPVSVPDSEKDAQRVPGDRNGVRGQAAPQHNNQNKTQQKPARARPAGYPPEHSSGNGSYSSTRPPRTGPSRAASPPSAGRGGVPPGMGNSSRPGRGAPPRPATTKGGLPAPRQQEQRFANFSAYEEAWSAFETGCAMGAEEISLQSIPWPLELPTVSGIDSTDSGSDSKRKLRAALLRWHPDKWGPILSRIQESDKNEVMERVKEVTRRILEEKTRHS